MNSKVIKGAAIIGVAGVIVKVLGAFFRIPLTNWLGADGMAYYGYAYTIYGALVVLATAGLPVAISRLVSENIAVKQYRNAHKVFHISMIMMFLLGAGLFLICFLGAKPLTTLLGNADAAPAVRAIAPALLFVPLLSALRGYFQGRQNMNPTAISEITEQLVRIISGLLLAYILLPKGLVKASAGAAFGASIGSLAGLLLVALIYLINKPVIQHKIQRYDQSIEETRAIVKSIVVIAIPIIIGSEIMPIMNMVDTGVIMRRLQATGFSFDESKHLYGLISSYCSTLIGFPQIFTQAVAISLVPAIARYFTLEDKEEVHKHISLGYRLTMLLAFPCAVGIFVLAKPVLLLLYPAKPAEVDEAKVTMMIMAVGIVGLALSQTSTGVLQAIGKQIVPVKHIAIGMVVKIILTYILVGINVLNINGAAISTIVAYVISFTLNNMAVKRYSGTKIDHVQTYVKPFIASAVMGIGVFLMYKLMRMVVGNSISTLVAIMIGVLIYGVLIIFLKVVTPEELETLPMGSKLNRLIRKFIRWE